MQKAIYFYSLLNVWVKLLAKQINKNPSSKYIEKLFDHAKPSATDAVKTTSKSMNQSINK